MSSRDEIFANFQACTGIEDVEHCIVVLEQNDWDLSKAINNVLSDSPTTHQQFDANTEVDNNIVNNLNILGDQILIQPQNDIEDIIMNDISTSPIAQSPSSQKKIRMVGFDVEWRGQIYPVVLPDTDTIGTIKECLASQLKLDPLCLKLHGFKVPSADWKSIRDMHLPKENHITMTVTDDNPTASTPSTSVAAKKSLQSSSVVDDSKLDIHVKDMRTEHTYPLKQSFGKTFGQLKKDLFSLTNIPSSRQVWSGVLSNSSPDATLKDCGLTKELNYFELNVSLLNEFECVESTSKLEKTVHENKDTDSNTKGEPESNKQFVDHSMSCDEDDTYDYPLYYEDYPENVQGSVRQLMPDNIENETASIENFRTVFQERYIGKSELCVPFFSETLEQAVQTMTDTPAHQRKPIFLYLHHDRSILANIFCSQVLCSNELAQFFIENEYALWPWDLTISKNKSRLLISLNKHLGSVEANRINQMNVDSFPIILMLSNLKYGNIQIFGTISGSCTLNEVMDQLLIFKSEYADLLAPHVSQAFERDQRELFRKEQYTAYLESLRLDQERDRIRELENDREEEERQKAKLIEENRQTRFLEAKSRLPEEPEDSADRATVACIRFRLPNGEQNIRRFTASQTLKNLIDYVESLGFPLEEVKIITTYPRKDLAVIEDMKMTMSDLKLVPQETLTLETK